MRPGRLAAMAALCVLAALVLVVAGCGGGSTTTTIEKTITDYAPTGGEGGGNGGGEEEAVGEEETVGREDAVPPSKVNHLRAFGSPTGNIGCMMFEGGARCDIIKRQWSPPPHPASCSQEVDYGQGLMVGHRGRGEFVCAGDTVINPTAPPLPYGFASVLGGTECVSRSEGVTCTNPAGHGFFISSQSHREF